MTVTYTRYADDLTFGLMPAVKTPSNSAIKAFVIGVENLLKADLGVKLNHKKTHYIFLNGKSKRQILGRTIRKDGLGYNAPVRGRKRARARLCNLWHKLEAKGWKPDEKDWQEWRRVLGYVQYMDNCRSESPDATAATADPMVQEKFWKPLWECFKSEGA